MPTKRNSQFCLLLNVLRTCLRSVYLSSEPLRYLPMVLHILSQNIKLKLKTYVSKNISILICHYKTLLFNFVINNKCLF